MAAGAPGVTASLAEQDQARGAELLFRLFVLLPASSGTADMTQSSPFLLFSLHCISLSSGGSPRAEMSSRPRWWREWSQDVRICLDPTVNVDGHSQKLHWPIW